MYSPRTEIQKDQRGFTLLLAALIVSIVLALGTSIFNLVQKELILSSIGRDSQFAFYAADTGAECALYWDIRHQRFPTSTPSTAEVICDNQSETTSALDTGDTIVSSFQFQPNSYCAEVSIEKSFDAEGAVRTVIHANGFNRSCDSIANSSRALQRSVELRY